MFRVNIPTRTARLVRIEPAAVLFAAVRGWLARRRLARRDRAVRLLQRHLVAWLHRRRAARTADASTRLVRVAPPFAATRQRVDQAVSDRPCPLAHPDSPPSDPTSRTRHPASPPARPLTALRTVSAAVGAAFLTGRCLQLAGAFAGVPYLEAHAGILSRRRMPRVRGTHSPS